MMMTQSLTQEMMTTNQWKSNQLATELRRWVRTGTLDTFSSVLQDIAAGDWSRNSFSRYCDVDKCNRCTVLQQTIDASDEEGDDD